MLGICYIFSSDKKNIDWKLVVMGIGIQILLAFLFLKVPFVRTGFKAVVDFFVMMVSASEKSAKFLFGELAVDGKYGFAFSVLPTIVFFSALSSIMYYFGILQKA